MLKSFSCLPSSLASLIFGKTIRGRRQCSSFNYRFSAQGILKRLSVEIRVVNYFWISDCIAPWKQFYFFNRCTCLFQLQDLGHRRWDYFELWTFESFFYCSSATVKGILRLLFILLFLFRQLFFFFLFCVTEEKLWILISVVLNLASKRVKFFRLDFLHLRSEGSAAPSGNVHPCFTRRRSIKNIKIWIFSLFESQIFFRWLIVRRIKSWFGINMRPNRLETLSANFYLENFSTLILVGTTLIAFFFFFS